LKLTVTLATEIALFVGSATSGWVWYKADVVVKLGSLEDFIVRKNSI
jgi:hypothetical protein